MNISRQVLLKISGMLLILMLLLMVPVFANWLYPLPIQEGTHNVNIGLNNFFYGPSIVTLPGDSDTLPPETTPPPPPESTPEESSPEESVPEETTPAETDPITPPVVADGENHSHLIKLLTIDYSEIYDNNKLNINVNGSVLERTILDSKVEIVYSKVPSYSGGSLSTQLRKGLSAADADMLEFLITAKFDGDTATEIVVYSYKTFSGSNAKVGDIWEVYQTYLKYENGQWIRDIYRTHVGDAKVIRAPGQSFFIPDYQNIEYR